MKITKEQLFEMIKKEALKIKKEIFNEQIEKVEDPIKVNMNHNDNLDASSDTDKALVYKDRTKKEEKEGPQTEELGGYDDKAIESINSQDKDQGQDEEISTAVEVEAGKEKGGEGHTAGQREGKFTSKKDNPKKEVSAPFDEETFDGKMNKEDRDIDEGAKTYVDAGEKKGGKTHTAGQAKANPKERAPEVKDEKPIADAIEIKGSNIKESYTKTELINFIKEEAQKLVKK